MMQINLNTNANEGVPPPVQKVPPAPEDNKTIMAWLALANDAST